MGRDLLRDGSQGVSVATVDDILTSDGISPSS